MSADDFVDHAYQGFRREWRERPENQSYIAACKRQTIEGEARFQELIKLHAICKQCAGVTEAVCWSTSTRMPLCACSSPSDDEEEVALLSPPQTPVRFEDFARLQQLRTNELLIEAGFEIETEPNFESSREPQGAVDVSLGVEAHLELQDPAEVGASDKMESKSSMIGRSEISRSPRVTRSSNCNKTFFELDSHGHPRVVDRRHQRKLKYRQKNRITKSRTSR